VVDMVDMVAMMDFITTGKKFGGQVVDAWWTGWWTGWWTVENGCTEIILEINFRENAIWDRGIAR
jgi:hypothetical protein